MPQGAELTKLATLLTIITCTLAIAGSAVAYGASNKQVTVNTADISDNKKDLTSLSASHTDLQIIVARMAAESKSTTETVNSMAESNEDRFDRLEQKLDKLLERAN